MRAEAKSLHTGRLRLEPVHVAHAAEMFPLLSDTRIYEHLHFKPPATLAELEERYRRQEAGVSPDGVERWHNWIVRLEADGGACAGFVQATLHTETTGDFGYIFGPAFWGRGIAFEACALALEALWADTRLARLFATVDRHNARSLALLSRLGFHRVSSKEYPHGRVLPSDDIFHLPNPPPS
ncbi:MAG TPA: GNAT family N-acetyltransferase [Verrucomicrobiales bacterium]|nr:GNAT family N-acetyltransferase [Verrucomicrobiales bacterium]HRJ09591.1 GNAT family N-acetyltransferase [Prosthecobacter sp.]HRK12650.1 GNAT family N-acetyltransferase [Prosthecobacter sp.]